MKKFDITKEEREFFNLMRKKLEQFNNDLDIEKQDLKIRKSELDRFDVIAGKMKHNKIVEAKQQDLIK